MEEAAKIPQDVNTTDDPSSSNSNRQVGMKSKREEDDDGTEWEEAPVRGTLYSLQSDYTEIWILRV